jgi:hypothetical protein
MGRSATRDLQLSWSGLADSSRPVYSMACWLRTTTIQFQAAVGLLRPTRVRI